MTTGGGGWGLLVAAASLASLFGVGFVRSAEQAPALLIEWLDGPLSAALPDAASGSPLGSAPAPPVPVAPELTELARSAWELYAREVRGRARLGNASAGQQLVSVIATRPTLHEIVLRVPAGGVLVGAPVAHRDVLVGFVHALAADGTRATVRLLSHPNSRPVAGEWRPAVTARPVHFLAYGRGDHLTVENRSSSVPPPPEQLARTRDVKFLGDTLPPGLLLGMLEVRELDQPGGGLGADPEFGGLPDGDLAVRLTPLLDARNLGVVMVPLMATDASPDAQAESVVVPLGARLLATARGAGHWRLDRGASDGLASGDLVVQDGALVGQIEVLGRGTSIVGTSLPGGPLLVVDDDGQVVPCGAAARDWPAGWLPAPGQVVVSGHAEHGGLLLGRIGSVDETGLSVVRADVDPTRPVLVLQR